MNGVATRVRLGYVLLALLLGFSLVAVGARPAYACSCAGTWDTDEEFQRSDAVFAGEVVEVGELSMERAGPTDPGMPLLAPVIFDVEEAWKGVEGDSVVGQGPGPSCGLDFERGEPTSSLPECRGRARTDRSRRVCAARRDNPA